MYHCMEVKMDHQLWYIITPYGPTLLQIVRIVSHLLVLSNGTKVVFEKCGCSHEVNITGHHITNLLYSLPN